MITVHSFIFNPFQENTYVVSDDDMNCIIIDPGCYTAKEKQEIAGFIGQHKMNPVRLINTHCHIDHVFGNRFIAETYTLKTEIHKLDLPTLHTVPRVAAAYNIPGVEIPPEPGIFLEEGDEINFGNTTIEVLFVPGHAPGHIALVCREQQFIIAGDVLFYGSIGRTDLPGGDYHTLINSIKNKLLPLGDEFKVYSGPGPETTIGFERQDNPFLE